MKLLWSKANAAQTRGSVMVEKYVRTSLRDAKHGFSLEGAVIRYRRVDEVNRRFRQWLSQRPPLMHNGKEVKPYMQLDSVPRPTKLKLVTGECVEYTGP